MLSRRMLRSERIKSLDWRAWIALAWAIWFGAQYVEMIAVARTKKAFEIIRSVTRVTR